MTRTALVTGGNRGIGLEVCRQLARHGHRVVLTSRVEEDAHAAAESLAGERGIIPRQLDVSDPESVRACAGALAERGIEVEILVNNAGVLCHGGALDTDVRDWARAFDVNVLGVIRTCRAFVPRMVERGWGRIVNVSSGMGTFSGSLTASPANYGVSKAAMNAYTVRLAAELPDSVKVNSVSPGWVRTRMGGDHATRSTEQGARGIVRAATLPDHGPTGQMMRDDRILDF